MTTSLAPSVHSTMSSMYRCAIPCGTPSSTRNCVFLRCSSCSRSQPCFNTMVHAFSYYVFMSRLCTCDCCQRVYLRTFRSRLPGILRRLLRPAAVSLADLAWSVGRSEDDVEAPLGSTFVIWIDGKLLVKPFVACYCLSTRCCSVA